MQALFGFIQNLSALVMMALLADLLMPSGTMRKYARLACGMLVLHIMVSQVFALLGKEMPDTAAREWTQLVGEIRAWPADSAAQEALAAYHRQAEILVAEKARALGMRAPVVAIAWDTAYRAVAVVLREGEDSVTAGANLSLPAASPPESKTSGDESESIRAGVAELLGLPFESVWIEAAPMRPQIRPQIRKEGEYAP